MKLIEQNITVQGESILLTNQAALFRERHQALILSDLHLGKAAHFRKHGIALPVQLALQDLERLDTLIHHYAAEQVIIVGDLIHAGANKEVPLFSALTHRHRQVRFTLIRGNHDRMSPDQLEAIGIPEIYDELTLDGITFTHDPVQDHPAPFVISGHIHPGVDIQFHNKQRKRFPCYVVTQKQLILPAFSRFTGLDTGRIPKGASCYAFHAEGIFHC